MTEKIRIIDAKEHVNEEVTIGAWLTDKRSSGKIAFLQLRDGSAYFQGVVSKADVPDEVFQLAKELRQESSMWITGVIHQDSRSHFGYEIEVRNIELVGDSHDYPITPKEQALSPARSPPSLVRGIREFKSVMLPIWCRGGPPFIC